MSQLEMPPDLLQLLQNPDDAGRAIKPIKPNSVQSFEQNFGVALS